MDFFIVKVPFPPVIIKSSVGWRFETVNNPIPLPAFHLLVLASTVKSNLHESFGTLMVPQWWFLKILSILYHLLAFFCKRELSHPHSYIYIYIFVCIVFNITIYLSIILFKISLLIHYNHSVVHAQIWLMGATLSWILSLNISPPALEPLFSGTAKMLRPPCSLELNWDIVWRSPAWFLYGEWHFKIKI